MLNDTQPKATEVITLADAARLAGLAIETLQTQRRKGVLRATKLGRDWTLTRGELHRYLMSRSRGPVKPLPETYIAPRGMKGATK